MPKQLIPKLQLIPYPHCFGYITSLHRAKLYFNNLARLFGTYPALQQHNMVASFRSNLNSFRTLVKHRGTTQYKA